MTAKSPTVAAIAPQGHSGARFKQWATEVFELTPLEQELVDQAASSLDRIAELEGVVRRDGPMAKGSRGQPVAHPALAELHAEQVSFLKLIKALEIPDEPLDHAAGLRSARAAHAAESRWKQTSRRRR